MPIPPLKHIIDTSSQGVNASTAQVITIATGTVNPNSYTVPTQVRNGSKITRLTVQIDYQFLSGSSELFDWYIWFNIGGAQARPNPSGANPSVLKNQIFHQDGALVQYFQATAVGYVVPWHKSWRLVIDVPRTLQQLNENDAIELVYIGQANNASTSIKVRVIYKEIFP